MLSKRVAHVLLATTAISAIASTLEAPVDNDIASAIPEDVAPSAVLVADDECLSADGSCALNALQQKSANLHKALAMKEQDFDKGDKDVALAEGSMPLHVTNNASNSVLLANCEISIALRPGSAIRGNMKAPGGFWVVPEDTVFNCSAGCADCFFISTFVDPGNTLKVRIGYGLDMGSVQPSGGGIMVKTGSETAECSDGDCNADWTKNMTVDTTSGSEVEVAILGTAKEPKESGSTEGGDDMGTEWRGGRGRRVHVGPTYVHVGPVVRRPGYYRPHYHPVARHAVACSMCIPYRCWYRCR